MRSLRVSVPLSAVIALALAGCNSATPSASPVVSAAAPSPSSGSSPTPPAPSGEPATTPAVPALPALGDVPFYRDDVLGQLVEPGPGPTGEPQLAWEVAIGATHWAPILVGGEVIAAAADGRVLALDAHTGAQRWQFRAEHGFSSANFNGSASAADGFVFVSDTAVTYAIDAATGTQRWSSPAPTSGSRPVVADGVVYVGTIGGALGLAEADGRMVWRWAGPRDVAFTAGPVVDGVAYLSSRSDGRLYAIDTHDGSERWHIQTIAVAVGSSEVVGDTIFVGTNQAGATEPVGQVYAIDRASGHVRWQFGSPGGQQLVPGPARDGILYVSSEGDGIHALRDDGSRPTQVWQVDAPSSVLPLSMVGDTLYEQRSDGSVGAYAAADGKLLWQTPPTGADGGGPPLVSGGMVFSVGDAKGIMAFADPSLVGLLPTPVAVAPSPSVEPDRAPSPFKVVQAFSWASTDLAVPLGMDAGPDGLLYVLDTKPSVEVIDPRDGHVVRTWGRQGTGPREFDLTRTDDNPGRGDIAVAPDGRVYVADGSNHRVQVFRPDGTSLTMFGSFGTGDGQFGTVDEIAIGRDGNVYTLDEANNRISKFSAEGKFRWRSPAPGSDPDLGSPLHGIAVRADGSILATCEQCGRFLVFDPTDGHIRGRIEAPKFDGDRFGPIELDPKGDMYVAMYSSNSQLVFDPTGRFLGGLYHQAGQPFTSINKLITWGDTFWPSPVFLPDGRGFTFGKDGLVELKVTLPTK